MRGNEERERREGVKRGNEVVARRVVRCWQTRNTLDAQSMHDFSALLLFGRCRRVIE